MILLIYILALGSFNVCDAHGYLTCPKPRQYRGAPVTVNNIKHGWTKWVGLVVPGSGAYMEGEGNAPNLNAAIGGGAANQDKGSQAGGHGLCGDLGGRNGFMAGGKYGPTTPRGVYKKGTPMQVKVLVSAYHAGWFEFRLAQPSSAATQAVDTTTPITQDMLNAHLLEIDPTTPNYAKVIDYQHLKGYNGNGGEYKCANTGGHIDPTSTTPQNVWPHGTCCNSGGTCSPPATNIHRYIIDADIPYTDINSRREYDVRLKIPSNIASCDRCVLQWAWTTANSQGTYPETFWNCADIKIEASSFTGTVGCDAGDQGAATGTTPGSTAGTSSDTGSSNGGTTSGGGSAATGWCATEWSEYGGEKHATCVACSSATDCPLNKACWGSTWCTESKLCGDASDAECADKSSTASGGTSTSDPDPTTAGPTGEFVCGNDISNRNCVIFTQSCVDWCGTDADAETTCNQVDSAQAYPKATRLNNCKCYQKDSKGIQAGFIARVTCPFKAESTTGNTPSGSNTASLVCGKCPCASITPNDVYATAPGFVDWCKNPAFKGDERFCACPDGDLIQEGGSASAGGASSGTSGTGTGTGTAGTSTSGTDDCKPGEQKPKPVPPPGGGTGNSGSGSTSTTTGTGTSNSGTGTGTGTGTGSGNPTPTPPTETADCPSDAKQVIVEISPMPAAPLVGYVGGSNWDSSFKWDDLSRVGHYDALVVGFANYWNTQCPSGPQEPGLRGTLPQLNTAACAGGKWLASPPGFTECGITQCGGCGEGTVGASVLKYQESGRRILISVGGANAAADDMDPQKGIALADSLWNSYLGGNDARYKGWRPFGPRVVFDGVDIDLEQTPPSCKGGSTNPASAGCTAVMEGWYNFVIRIRELMDDDTRKRYYITAVPINTKYADPDVSFSNYGSYTHGYLPGQRHCDSEWTKGEVKASLEHAIRPLKSLFRVAHLIDYIWPQFYPSPAEITLAASGANANCWLYDFLAWTYIPIEAARKRGEKNRCRIGIGIPFGRGAANGGQVEIEIVSQKLQSALKQYPVLKNHFGGMFGWDEYWDTRSLGGWGYGGSQVAKDLGNMLRSDSFQTTLKSGVRRLRGESADEEQPNYMLRILSGKNLGNDQCTASYDKDWTLGGALDGGTWKSRCGCKKVPYVTTFTDVLGCVDSWVGGNSGTSCVRIDTGTSDDSLKGKGITESAGTGGADDSNSGSTVAKPPTAVVDPNSKTGVSVTTTSGKTVAVTSLPQRVAFSLKLAFSAQNTAPSCDDVKQVDTALRKMLCKMHTSSYTALGYVSTTRTASQCGRSQLEAQYGGKDVRRVDCDSSVTSSSMSARSSSTMVSRDLSTEDGANVLHVRATFLTAYPDVVPKEEAEVQQYVGHQIAACEMVAQQLRVMSEAGLITSQFDSVTLATVAMFVGAIETGPDAEARYITINTTLAAANTTMFCEDDPTLPECNPPLWIHSTVAIVIFIIFS